MAVDRFFTGFEGNGDVLASISNFLYVDDGNARTGQFLVQANVPSATTNSGRANGPAVTAGQGISSEYATGRLRIWFKLLVLPSADGPIIAGYGTVGGVFQGTLRIKGNGTFAAAERTNIGTYSTAVLAINTWYKLELLQTITDDGVDADYSISASVYNEAGTLIETVTKSVTGLTTNPNFAPVLIGHADAISSTFLVQYDDLISIVEDNGPATLPTADRITRVDVTERASASSWVQLSYTDGWVGDYRKVTDIPFEASLTDEITSTDLNDIILFTHKTAAQLGISGVIAINFYTRLKASVAGNEAIIINNNISVLPTPDAYGTNAIPFRNWFASVISDDDFTNLKFGIINMRSLDLELGQMYGEVLHSGTNPWPASLIGVDSWKHKVVTYTGNGTYQNITGLGFKPQVILIKKFSGTSSTGVFKVGCMGGTRSKVNNATTITPLAITEMLSDGFSLGPSVHANELDAIYMAFCAQDGGFELDCKFLNFGTYVGTGLNPKDVVIPGAGFPPKYIDTIFVSGTIPAIWHDVEGQVAPTDENSKILSTSPDVAQLIDGFVTDVVGFFLGSDVRTNGLSAIYYFFTISNWHPETIGRFFTYDTFESDDTTYAYAFYPPFDYGLCIAKKKASSADAQWKCAALHSGDTSGLWSNLSTNTTGIGTIAEDAFGTLVINFGTTLSEAGEKIALFIFSEEGEVLPEHTAPVVDAGPDQLFLQFDSVANLSGFVDFKMAFDIPPYICGDELVLWTKVSGPGTVTFSDPAFLGTDVEFSVAGTYILRLTATNGLVSVSDDVQITELCGALIVNAGPDQEILIDDPNATMDGSVSIVSPL